MTISSIIRDGGAIDAPVLIHFVSTGLTIGISGGAVPNGRVMRYGDDLVVTDEIRRLNKDRDGESCFDSLDNEDEQIKRWGRVMMRRGPWPEHRSRLEPDSEKWQGARESARSAAHAIQDEREKQQALLRIDDEFGPAPRTSRTLKSFR